MSNRITEGNEPCINEWNKFLNEFDEIKPNDKAAYEKLKERAANSSIMTYRQKDGIKGRCDHKLSLIQSGKKEEGYSPNDYNQKRMTNKGGTAK